MFIIFVSLLVTFVDESTVTIYIINLISQNTLQDQGL
jgi:hypothetical protein